MESQGEETAGNDVQQAPQVDPTLPSSTNENIVMSQESGISKVSLCFGYVWMTWFTTFLIFRRVPSFHFSLCNEPSDDVEEVLTS
jgi:hypothetical protein